MRTSTTVTATLFIVKIAIAFPLLLLAQTASAEEVKLSADQIRAYLSGKIVVNRPEGKTSFRQSFEQNGQTRYQETGRKEEVGYWNVQGDRYCSQWGPFGWSCYVMTAEGNLLTWIAEDGTRYPGQLEKP
ncbi:hypothetical protein O4H49_07590 [Kiloniella laminariae]|uniref:Uncharacterized protein n=1 Tax=Kiloniella laminariae TaxID=454162 RepID=A0ABT4LJV8_9PROT|nr:hypothetical protein [Kiloniella laminariae]MCZ4280636.1 hypothetical protein [Kiloniella laminariae]